MKEIDLFFARKKWQPITDTLLKYNKNVDEDKVALLGEEVSHFLNVPICNGTYALSQFSRKEKLKWDFLPVMFRVYMKHEILDYKEIYKHYEKFVDNLSDDSEVIHYQYNATIDKFIDSMIIVSRKEKLKKLNEKIR